MVFTKYRFIPGRWAMTMSCATVCLSLLLTPAVNGQVERSAELIEKTVSATPIPANGSRLYHEHCIGCHGSGAVGDAANVVPALAGQRELYLIKQLVDFAELNRDTPEMHRLMARKELGSPQNWRDLSAYLSGLGANDHPQLGNGHALTTGKRIYKETCAECHGVAGEGDDSGSTPALRGQHYAYLVLQLRGFAAGHRLDIELPVLEYVAGLSVAELEGVADYVSRLPVENSVLTKIHAAAVKQR